MAFDEQPDGDPHGECAAEIHRLQSLNKQLLDALIDMYAVARVDRDEDYFAITNAAAVIAKATGD